MVNRLAPGSRCEPCPRITWNALGRPMLQGGDKGFLQRIFGQVKVAQAADEGFRHYKSTSRNAFSISPTKRFLGILPFCYNDDWQGSNSTAKATKFAILSCRNLRPAGFRPHLCLLKESGWRFRWLRRGLCILIGRSHQPVLSIRQMGHRSLAVCRRGDGRWWNTTNENRRIRQIGRLEIRGC